MKKLLLAAAAMVAVPAQAGVLLPGGTSTFDAFDANTRGTLLAYSEVAGTALTFSAIFKTGVYRNTLGTIDFYHQVVRTGPGSDGGDDEIVRFTVANYAGWAVETFRDGTDFDGAGGFLAAGNPGTFTSGGTRSPNAGGVVGANFHATGFNGLVGTENSTTYIFRTNAPSFTAGTFGVLDGAALQGVTFAPNVPEPATWAMMIGGFGMLGAAARRSRRAKTVLA